MRFKDTPAFYATRTEEERAQDKRVIFTVALNEKESRLLRADMAILRQPKPSTALKTLAAIGRAVLHDQKTGAALRAVLDQIERNERIGVPAPEVDSAANVTQENDEK